MFFPTDKDSKKPKDKTFIYKAQRWFTKDYRKIRQKWLNLFKERSVQTKQEKEMEKSLREIMLRDFRTNNKERKFRFGHIEELLEEYKVFPKPDIIFVYGKKNIGKTWELARKITAMRDQYPNGQFVFIRNKQQDESALHQMFSEEIWPVTFHQKKLFWKDDLLNNVPNPSPAGWFTYTTGAGFQSLQGSSFNNLKLIVWDECNDTDGNKLTAETLKKFCILTSSLIRGKKDVETYMMGNLLDKKDDTVNVFLNRMGVDPEVRLKFIDVKANSEITSRLLYINALDDYKGIEDQKGIATQFLTDEEQESLFSNLPMKSTDKSIYTSYQFIKLKPLISICFSLTAENKSFKDYILYISKKPNRREYVMWISEFNKKRIFPGFETPITIEEPITGTEVAPMFVLEDIFYQYIQMIRDILISGQLWFGINDTYYLFRQIWVKWSKDLKNYSEKRKIIF